MAFVSHMTVFEFTGIDNDLNPGSDFKLLCPDGTRAGKVEKLSYVYTQEISQKNIPVRFARETHVHKKYNQRDMYSEQSTQFNQRQSVKETENNFHAESFRMEYEYDFSNQYTCSRST